VGGKTKRPFSLRALLLALALVLILPISIVAGLLLARSAMLERAQLEGRLLQVVDDLAAHIDRDLSNRLTTLQTLASSPALRDDDLARFHAQASAAVTGWGSIFLVDPYSMQQVVNTLVPWGTLLPKTGDPTTVQRVLSTGEPQISDYFVGVVSRTPTFDIDYPVFKDGKVRYVLLLGLGLHELANILRRQRLKSEWVTAVLDRQGVLLARSSGSDRHVGTAPPTFYADLHVRDHAVHKTVNLEGEPVLRAIARSQLSGWVVNASIPISIAEAPLETNLRLWGITVAVAIALGAALAWSIAHLIGNVMASAAKIAERIGHQEDPPAFTSRIAEANTLVSALERANADLAKQAKHQRLLLNELSHRVKNVLTVVQAIVGRSLAGERSLEEARKLIDQRVQALGRAHDLLMRTDWQGAAIKDIISAELAPFGARVECNGPDVMIDGKMVQTLALVLHELATNAVKYGALSNPEGRVAISWSIESGKDPRFKLRWEEKGGPRVAMPERKGFGTTLLESAVTDPDMKPRLNFGLGGFIYELEAPLA